MRIPLKSPQLYADKPDAQPEKDSPNESIQYKTDSEHVV